MFRIRAARSTDVTHTWPRRNARVAAPPSPYPYDPHVQRAVTPTRVSAARLVAVSASGVIATSPRRHFRRRHAPRPTPRLTPRGAEPPAESPEGQVAYRWRGRPLPLPRRPAAAGWRAFPPPAARPPGSRRRGGRRRLRTPPPPRRARARAV